MTVIRSVQTKGLPALLPIYGECQNSFNAALADRSLLKRVFDLPETISKNGKVRKCQIGDYYRILNPHVKKYSPANVPNPSWYLRIIMYNLICLRDSLKWRTAVFNCLKECGFDLNAPDLRTKLEAKNLYPSQSFLSTLARSRKKPDFPETAVFRMDYAYSDRQMCTFDPDEMIFRVMTTPRKQADQLGIPAWSEFKLILPAWIGEQARGKICKPLFFMNKEGEFICQMAYHCEPESHPEFQNVLGVDLGRVKLYSASVLYEDGTCSNEFVPSKELDRLTDKLDRLQIQIDCTYSKLKRCEAYRNTDEKSLLRQQARKDNYYYARKKRTRIKEKMAWLAAEEIVQTAVKHQCKEIHIEQLRWINNKGGKWDYSQIQKRIADIAELHGIEVVKVSCSNSSKTHPETQEIGIPSGRNILFKDGTKADRDQLAGLNLALRSKKGEVRQAKLAERKTEKVRRSQSRRLSNRRKKETLCQASGTSYKTERRTGKIALFSSRKAGFPALAFIQSKGCYDGCYIDWNLLPIRYSDGHFRHRQSICDNL